MPNAQQAITKKQFILAQHSAKKLQVVVDAMNNLDTSVFAGSLDGYSEAVESLPFLQGCLSSALAVIEQAKFQYENRNQSMILAAALRHTAIDQDIAVAKNEQISLATTYESKTKDLIEKKFTQTEIEAILTNPAEQIAALDVVIDELKNEKLKIKAYLADGPRYSETYLIGTRVPELAAFREASGIAINPFAV